MGFSSQESWHSGFLVNLNKIKDWNTEKLNYHRDNQVAVVTDFGCMPVPSGLGTRFIKLSDSETSLNTVDRGIYLNL